jgi:hypothetical protein
VAIAHQPVVYAQEPGVSGCQLSKTFKVKTGVTPSGIPQ